MNNSCIVPDVITYGTQTWTFAKENQDRIRKTERVKERNMPGITLKDRKTNEWIINKTKTIDTAQQAATLK